MWIDHGDHNSCNTGSNQGVATRWGTPLMATRFESYIGDGVLGPASSVLEGHDLGVCFACSSMPSFAHDLTALHQNTADPRVGRSAVEAEARKPQCPGHEAMVARIRHLYQSVPGFGSGGPSSSFRRSTSLRKASTS